MKISKILILCVILLNIIFACSSMLQAESIDIYGGVAYNYYALEDLNEKAIDYGSEEFEFGSSYFGGIDYKVKENIFVGGEIEYLESNWKLMIGDVHANSMGLLGNLKYKISTNLAKFNLIGGLGLYTSEIETNINDFDTGKEQAVGFKIGMESEMPIRKDLSMNFKSMYRNNNAKFENMNLDYSGMELGTCIKYKF